MSVLARARLRLDLAWAHALVWLATTGRRSELTPDVQLYFADLHFKLADEYLRAGKWVKARKHRVIANAHAAAGPPPEPRPAAAMAMPAPAPLVFTDARAWPHFPDDIA